MPPPITHSVLQQQISGVYLHELFLEISDALGYSLQAVESYRDDIAALIELWTQQGFVEIYTQNADRKYGRVKDSNSVPNSSPWYIDLYHARLLATGENDPLIAVVFESIDEDGQSHPVASIRFMLDHDDMFGAMNHKLKPAMMTAIRRRIDDFIQKGNRPAE